MAKKAKKSFNERILGKIEQEMKAGDSLTSVLKRFKMRVIPVNNGTDYKRLIALSRSLDFLGLVGQLYIKDPNLLLTKEVKEYFDYLRDVDEKLTKLSDLYYSDNFKELKQKLFKRAEIKNNEIEDEPKEEEIIIKEEEGETTVNAN